MTEKRRQEDIITFKAGDRLMELIESRARGQSTHQTARRDLERYYNLVALGLLDIQLTEPEASLIIDATNGLLATPATIHLIWANVDYAIRSDGLDEKWDVYGPALIDKLRAMIPAQLFALVDAIERFWSDGYHVEDMPARLREVGLVK